MKTDCHNRTKIFFKWCKLSIEQLWVDVFFTSANISIVLPCAILKAKQNHFVVLRQERANITELQHSLFSETNRNRDRESDRQTEREREEGREGGI